MYKFVKDLLNGLDYLYSERKISHGDIKPANILLMEEDISIIKIADFGIAHKMREDTMKSGKSGCSKIQGSVPYYSPEMLLKL